MSADADKKEDKLKDLTGEDAHVAVKQPHGGVLSATPRMTSFRGRTNPGSYQERCDRYGKNRQALVKKRFSSGRPRDK